MTNTPLIRLIANPAAGRGRAGRRLPAARAAFARVGVTDVRLTQAPGDEARLASEAARDSIETLAVLGGDGTWSRVGATLVQLGSATRLLPIAAGTGNDFARTLGLPQHDLGALANLALHGRTRQIDAGEVDGHVFLNVAGFGFDVAVLEACVKSRLLRGTALYLAMAARELFGYPGFSAILPPPFGKGDVAERLFLIVIANGRRFGGAFDIAPGARIDDGALDVITFGTAGPLRRMVLFAAATRGAHIHEAEVTSARGSSLTISFPSPPLFDADGELVAAAQSDVRIRCLPGALAVVSAEPLAHPDRSPRSTERIEPGRKTGKGLGTP